MIFLMNIDNRRMVEVKPTIFPDGTSQVWRLPIEEFEGSFTTIIWYFESEGEIIHLAQLLTLLDSYNVVTTEIFIPFLPYARQDKDVGNENTFALKSFMSLMNFIREGRIISTLDIHSKQRGILSYPATKYIKEAIQKSQSNVVIYPDAGAAARYQCKLDDIPYVILEKNRDQSTGVIKGIKFSKETEHVEIDGKRLLIVDDICDGGATFLSAARLLYQYEIDWLALYVTHGIFSKGFDHLIDGGIREFYTTRSLRKNVGGFSLTEI